MITDTLEIVPHPDKDKEYRKWMKIAKTQTFSTILKERYNYSITCPVCENETRFWRDIPFPTDQHTP